MPGDREVVFLAKIFIEESDSNYREFFKHFLQIDEGGQQSNNQMFMNFIDLRFKAPETLNEDERIKVDHF